MDAGCKKLEAGALCVKSAAALLGCAVLHKLANPADRAAALFEHRGEDVPRVNHVRPHLELDVHARRSCGFRALEVAIEQGFASVTPLKVDLTRHSAVKDLSDWLGSS